MICFCDSGKAVIGEVYQRMNGMLTNMKDALVDKMDTHDAIVSLISERWDKMIRPFHCLAYVPLLLFTNLVERYDKCLLTPFKFLILTLNGGESWRKPHADPYIDSVYLDVVERPVIDPMEHSVVRHQLSEFISSKGTFARPQAIEDRETMSAISWWDMYGVTTNELYNLAIKVLSQSVNTSVAEREWSTYSYIHGVKKNKMNVDRAESLVYVHYNHRLLSRCKSNHKETYKNWDVYANDDNLDIDIEAINDRECCVLLDSLDQIEESSTYTQNKGVGQSHLGKGHEAFGWTTSADTLKKQSKHMKVENSVKPQACKCFSCSIEFDGASKGNPGLSGAGAVIRADDGSLVCRVREGVGIATNNVAEYRAIILGLRHALKKGFTQIRVQGDSKLVCMQVQGLWKTKNDNMAILCKQVKELVDKFVSFQISHVLRV
ncbi:hypothetical protein IFM89_002547 [Coptis chinensis]|uniref:RNase H type-1 domain-containing protein n=1 Tax=Coptis chinensis TaxID=261450 RepID=A0A835HIH2_9MAGN|nr:hypothetical protein IFM89_002547 [Coptis chinensis]